MRRVLVAALILTLSATADAADITVFSPGIANAGLRQLADQWTSRTGNKVIITGGNIGRILDNVSRDVPADLILLPPDNLVQISAKLRSERPVPVGRALFGLAVKAGAPHADISSLEKFSGVLKAAGVLGYPDPASGSLSGGMIAEMLKQPEFAGVTARPLKENAAAIVKKGDAPYSGGAISEEITDPGAELVGLFPAELEMHIDLSGAVPNNAPSPADGAAFLKYITTPEAADIWHDCGIDTDARIVKAPRSPCVLAPARP